MLYLGLRGLPGKSALWRGWWYGFGAFGAGTSWIYVSIHDYGAASVPLASFLMLGFTAGVAFFFALPAWLWARCLRRDNAPLGDALAFAALWLALELFRSWFLTGFPGSTPAIASCRDRWPGWYRWAAYGCPPSSSPSARPCW
ncbi:hypothetical protein P4056_02225 [Pseudomonas aeruginosa]|nr:hypothetical protein [Pseudomonas aeruginosa]